MASIRTKLITDRLHKLVKMFGKSHQSIDVLELLRLHEKQDFRGMLAVIKRQMRIYIPVRVCYVNNPEYGPEKSIAWVDGLQFVPVYGLTIQQGNMPSIYLRKKALTDMPISSLVFAMAHELAHILLTAFRSELSTDEEATDLLAILLGYGTYYATGKTYHAESFPHLDIFLKQPTYTSGYLSHDEIIYAEMLLRQ